MEKTDRTLKGIIALVVLTIVYGLTAVMARFFSDSVGIFEQWYIRFAFAGVFTYLVFYRKIRLHTIIHASRKEHMLVAARGLIGFVVAAGLYAWSTQLTSIGAVAAMQVVPTTAFFGWLLLHERISADRFGLIIMAFFGALLIVTKGSFGVQFGMGEIMSLISGALFSLTFVLRKLQTGELNNYELAFVGLIYGAMGNYVMAVLTSGVLVPPTSVLNPTMASLFIGAAALTVAMSLLSNYGFEHVKATTASIILDMELVVGCILGYVVYREVLRPSELLGALVILGAVLAIGYREVQSTTVAS